MKLSAVLLLACGASLAGDIAAQGVQTLDRAEMRRVVTDTAANDDTVERWTPVSLPHAWVDRAPKVFDTVWYRMRFDVPPGDLHGYVLYAPRVPVLSLDLYLNGRVLSLHEEHAPFYSNIVQLYVRVPNDELRVGENVLLARVNGSPAWLNGMPRLYFGKARELASKVRTWGLLQVGVSNIFGFAFGLAGLLALAIWVVDRSDALLLYGATGVAFGVLSAVVHVSFGDSRLTFLQMTIHFLRQWGPITPLAILYLRLTGWRVRWLEWTLWGLLAFAALGLVQFGHEWRYLFWVVFGLFYSVLPLLFLAPIVRPRVVMPRISRSALMIASIVVVSFNLHDWATRLGLLAYDGPQLWWFVVPFFMIACGMVIFERFATATRRQRELTVELEARVAQKTREIEVAHARMRAADEERALVRERRRIMADMHDGLGARLVGLLSQVQSGRSDPRLLEEGLRAALEELRTTIDSLQPVEGDLGVVLGNVRHRMRTVFDSAGLELGWRVGELPPMDDLTPARNLAIQRILLELFTNVLKHSGARRVDVSTQAGAGRASIVIEDDGRGFDVGSRRRGRGLANLEERAREAGGTLVIESEPGKGTRATLALPAAA